MILNGRFLTSLTMFILFAGACLLALDLPAKAAFMPLLIGVPGTLLCGAQLILDLRRGPDPESDPADDTQAEGARTEAEVFIWLGLFTASILGFGFIVGGTLVVGGFVKYCSRESWKNAFIAAAGTFVVLFGVFIWLLELTLFPGLILGPLLK